MQNTLLNISRTMHSILWLAVGLVLFLFSHGRVTIPICSWFAFVFLIRFHRTSSRPWLAIVSLWVGMSVCHQLLAHSPKRLVVASLRKKEALEAVEALKRAHPDSPTRPSVLPLGIVSDTSSTAFTTPSSVKKCQPAPATCSPSQTNVKITSWPVCRWVVMGQLCWP